MFSVDKFIVNINIILHFIHIYIYADKLWLSHNKKGIWNEKGICNICGATLNDEQQCNDCIENEDVEMIQ